MSETVEEKEKKEKRMYRRWPFPRHSLEDSIKIPEVIHDKNNGKPWNPLYIAEALDMSPSSSTFRYLLSSSMGYGLTKGSYRAKLVEMTPLSVAITKPRSERERIRALQEAAQNPKIFRAIYDHYADGKYPSADDFFKNMLELDFGVRSDLVDECIELLEKNGRYSRIIKDIKGSPYVVFELPSGEEPLEEKEEAEEEKEGVIEEEEPTPSPKPVEKKFFIAHGKNKIPLEQLIKILTEFKVPYVVAVDEPHSGRPISKKIEELMNKCSSAIFIFTADETCVSPDGLKTYRPSDNVVYELGAASYLYGDNIVIFKEDGVTFASDFSDLGYITFEKDNLKAKAPELLRELVGFGILKITVA